MIQSLFGSTRLEGGKDEQTWEQEEGYGKGVYGEGV